MDTNMDLTILINRKNHKERKIVIPVSRTFYFPDFKNDDPLIFWVWEKRLKPAMTIKQRVIIMNLYSLVGMKEEESWALNNYLSSVLVEEITHCYTKELRNHRKWIGWLQSLHNDLM